MKKQRKKANVDPSSVVLPDVLMYKKNDQFLKSVKELDADNKSALLETMRQTREFYKKVLVEDYRALNEKSYRYVEAKLILERLNVNGKALKQVIETNV